MLLSIELLLDASTASAVSALWDELATTSGNTTRLSAGSSLHPDHECEARRSPACRCAGRRRLRSAHRALRGDRPGRHQPLTLVGAHALRA